LNFQIRLAGSYLAAEIFGRETSYDMREFLLAVKAACLEHACPRVLISIRASRPMFKAEDYGLKGYVNDLVTPSCRIALVGDTSELNFAHEYIELVARQQQVNVRSFREHASALRWLAEESPPPLGSDPFQPAGTPKLA